MTTASSHVGTIDAGSAGEIVGRIIVDAMNRGRMNLLEPEAKQVCVAYGIPTPRFGVAHNPKEAAELAKSFGSSVVLKIVSPDILHKTEAGGVIVGLKTKEQVEAAYERILSNVEKREPRPRVEGILVQSMVPAGVEVIVGGLRDSQFGPTVLFGLGGVFVEVLKDASFRVAPLTDGDSRQMIEEIRGYPILKGIRGEPASDEEAIIQIIQAVSKIILENDQIQQMDLNPVIVHAKDAAVADARILIG
jgi:acetyl-CoA synthetase (ADP-forming)